MTAKPLMTQAQMTRALEYVVAAHDSDRDAMDRLEAVGHPPMRYLLADLMRLLVRSVAVAEEQTGEEAGRRDHAAALEDTLIRALEMWAESAQPDVADEPVPDYHHASAGLAAVVIDYVMLVLDGDPGDLTGRLQPFRDAWADLP
ncbi:hypothetical protein ACF08W_34595 [Streptomyces sp. NPDC015144]|uniref:hypothetical protein n=1 Tax=Streptomyces sp. NPDC015144 TaxID=3364944 RepID=UPI0036FB334C